MDKSKGVHKYSRLRHGLRWIQYLIQKAALVPLALLYGIFMVVGCFGTAVLVVQVWVALTEGNAFLAFASCLGLILCGGGTFFLGLSLREGTQTSVGNLFDPMPPEENPILSDEDLLVRASSSAAQPAELLRAAQETTEQKPEELLRAGTEREA